MPQNFTALDFETANSDRTSICSIGIVRVEEGRIVSKIHQLINPCAPFQYWNTKIHGITQFDVRNSPTFAEYWDSVSDYFKDNVVAHNAAFDISCLKQTVEHFGLEPPDFDYFCTLCISRKNLCLPSHKLDEVARHFQLPSFDHHNALADAIICAKIFHRLRGAFDIEPFRKKFACVGQSQKKSVSARNGVSKFAKTEICKPITQKEDFFDYPEIDFTKSFLVVGNFSNYDAEYIRSLIMREEGQVKRSVDEFPDYVVVGSKHDIFSPYGEYPEAAYVAKKSGIPVIPEEHFILKFPKT